MPDDIGYQDGMKGFVNWVRKLDPSVKFRPFEDRPASRSEWFWLEKFEWALNVLQDDFDARNPPNSVPPPNDPPPPNTDPALSGYAPQSYNKGSRGQDARYNIRFNCELRPDGKYVDRQGCVYSDGGLSEDGRRSGQWIDGLKPADMMDGKDPWEPYEWEGRTVPPYPAKSWER